MTTMQSSWLTHWVCNQKIKGLYHPLPNSIIWFMHRLGRKYPVLDVLAPLALVQGTGHGPKGPKRGSHVPLGTRELYFLR